MSNKDDRAELRHNKYLIWMVLDYDHLTIGLAPYNVLNKKNRMGEKWLGCFQKDQVPYHHLWNNE